MFRTDITDVISKRSGTTFSQPFPPPSDPPANAPWFFFKISALYKSFTYLLTYNIGLIMTVSTTNQVSGFDEIYRKLSYIDTVSHAGFRYVFLPQYVILYHCTNIGETEFSKKILISVLNYYFVFLTLVFRSSASGTEIWSQMKYSTLKNCWNLNWISSKK